MGQQGAHAASLLRSLGLGILGAGLGARRATGGRRCAPFSRGRFSRGRFTRAGAVEVRPSIVSAPELRRRLKAGSDPLPTPILGPPPRPAVPRSGNAGPIRCAATPTDRVGGPAATQPKMSSGMLTTS